MAPKKAKNKKTIEEIRDISNQKANRKKIEYQDDDVEDWADGVHYEDVYDDEDPDYIRGNEDGI